MVNETEELRLAVNNLERKIEVLTARLEKISDSIILTTQAATTAATAAAAAASTAAAVAAAVQATASTLAAVQEEKIKIMSSHLSVQRGEIEAIKNRQWLWAITSVGGAGGITAFINHLLGKV